MLKAVIFDLDGTIGDTLKLAIEAFKKAINPFMEVPISDKEIMNTFGPSEEGTIRALIPEHYEAGVNLYLKYYEELHYMCPEPFEGIKDLISHLKKSGIIVALVTGKGKKSNDISLKQYGMLNTFDKIETGHPYRMSKPEGIQAVIDHFKLEPSEALYVGDAVSDITSARQVGIPVVSALWSSLIDEAEIKKASPDAVFYKVSEFRDFVDSLI